MNAVDDRGRDPVLRGRLLHDEPMSRHTVWAVGGGAERYYEPADLADLSAFLGALPADEEVHWVGLGSNLLVRDGGIPGVVIMLTGGLDELALVGPGRVRAEAGTPCAKVARFCARQGLVGAEFLAGIPGTVGGALAMNAGAFGGETWPIVERVECMDRQGTVRVRGREDFQVGYRSVQGPEGEWFVAAEFALQAGDAAEANARIRDLLRRRAETQPTGQRSCGSVFRNPPGDYAGRLIEDCGLKGRRRGGAEVSTKHANFILNTGDASAADIEGLIREVIQAVESRHGIRLRPEVRILGQHAGPGREVQRER